MHDEIIVVVENDYRETSHWLVIQLQSFREELKSKLTFKSKASNRSYMTLIYLESF